MSSLIQRGCPYKDLPTLIINPPPPKKIAASVNPLTTFKVTSLHHYPPSSAHETPTTHNTRHTTQDTRHTRPLYSDRNLNLDMTPNSQTPTPNIFHVHAVSQDKSHPIMHTSGKCVLPASFSVVGSIAAPCPAFDSCRFSSFCLHSRIFVSILVSRF